MTATTLQIKDATGATVQVAGDLTNGVFTPNHIVTASSLPTGAATEASLVALKTALGTPLQANGAVTISGVATAANQTSGITSLASIDTKLGNTLTVTGPLTSAQLGSAGLATSALQTTGNTSLAAIATSVSGTLKTDTVVQATSVSRSGTITAGGTAQVLMAANASRRGFVVQNNSSGPLYINGLGTATSDGQSLTIPGGLNYFYETSAQHTGTGAVSILGATTGQAFYAREY